MPIKKQPGELAGHILIVEPAPEMAEHIAGLLRGHGYRQVEVVHSAEEAIEHLARKLPEVALIDYHLPGMSATDLLYYHIRRSPELEYLPCVALLSEADTYEDIGLFGEGYVPGWLLAFFKPLPNDFLDMMDRFLLWKLGPDDEGWWRI